LARFSFNHNLKSQLSPIPIIPDGTAAGVQSPGGCAVESPIAGLAEELENTNLTSSVEPLSSAVLPATNLQNSTDGGDDKLVEPIKMKKPWDAFPKFTVNAGCTKCRNSWAGCGGNKPNTCLIPFEHKVRTSITTLMANADPDKYKSTRSIRFKEHLQEEDGTPSAEVAEWLPAALKANGYKPGIYEFGGEEEDAREGTTRLTCTFVIPENT
jgi:hypothetical protein